MSYMAYYDEGGQRQKIEGTEQGPTGKPTSGTGKVGELLGMNDGNQAPQQAPGGAPQAQPISQVQPSQSVGGRSGAPTDSPMNHVLEPIGKFVGSQASQMGGGEGGGGLGSIMGLVGMMSDENLKENIEGAETDLNEFLDGLTAHKYNYKDPEKDGHGKFVSVMAQDLEKSALGRSMVIDTPRGKMVDYGRGFAAMLAANVMLHQKLKRLETLMEKRGS